MPRRDLSGTLRGLVSRHGMSAVLHCLADIESLPDSAEPCSEPSTHNPSKSKPSAAACVGRMTLSPHKAGAVRRAAELFDDKRFLPALSDIREFSRVPWSRPAEDGLAGQFHSSGVRLYRGPWTPMSSTRPSTRVPFPDRRAWHRSRMPFAGTPLHAAMIAPLPIARWASRSLSGKKNPP